MSLPNVEINLTGPGRGEIFIGGEKIPGVKSLTFHAEANAGNTLMLELIVDKLKVKAPAEIMTSPISHEE